MVVGKYAEFALIAILGPHPQIAINTMEGTDKISSLITL